tara:strand:+ start:1621 stop:1842 length:222 start_codon:yes stop_codon:yes gene_type:complete
MIEEARDVTLAFALSSINAFYSNAPSALVSILVGSMLITLAPKVSKLFWSGEAQGLRPQSKAIAAANATPTAA